MPQKSRVQKERAAARRDSGMARRPVAPAPIELEAEQTDSGLRLNVPKPARRVQNAAAVLPHSSDAEFNYSYVFADLRRIAILAVLCFGAMVALAFVLPR
jgi:hypothetical protein